MSAQTRRRIASLLEVFGVYLTGAFLSNQVAELLVRWHVVSAQSPFELLTPHSTNSELLVASRQLLLTLIILYGSYFALIIAINHWRGRRGPAAYGLTREGRSWNCLILAGLATSCLTQWPVLVHTLVDAVHPLGAMAPWRQAFFAMSWHRWQFWLFAGILSYGLIPFIEELIFRGYYQHRLAEDWGNGPAVIGTACFFTFAHKQYLIANAYNVTMIASLFCMAIGLGIVYAWTRSLVPSIVAHALINIPMTPVWQGVLLAAFVVGACFAWRGGIKALKVFRKSTLAACVLLAVLETAYVVGNGRIPGLTYVSVGMLLMALVLEAVDRHNNPARPISPDVDATS
jgi:membrane protease YdiL (CAAX protease family)